MLGLFIVVTYVEQRFIVLPNTAGKKELYGSSPCLFKHTRNSCFSDLYQYQNKRGNNIILLSQQPRIVTKKTLP